MRDGKYQGCNVAIKCLKTDVGDTGRVFKVPLMNIVNHCRSTFVQMFCREVITWKHLSHPNILPLLGVSISTDTLCLRILTLWIVNGNVMQYARSNPVANRLQLVSPLTISSLFISCSSRIIAFQGHVWRDLSSRPQDHSWGYKRSESDLLEIPPL